MGWPRKDHSIDCIILHCISIHSCHGLMNWICWICIGGLWNFTVTQVQSIGPLDLGLIILSSKVFFVQDNEHNGSIDLGEKVITFYTKHLIVEHSHTASMAKNKLLTTWWYLPLCHYLCTMCVQRTQNEDLYVDDGIESFCCRLQATLNCLRKNALISLKKRHVACKYFSTWKTKRNK